MKLTDEEKELLTFYRSKIDKMNQLTHKQKMQFFELEAKESGTYSPVIKIEEKKEEETKELKIDSPVVEEKENFKKTVFDTFKGKKRK